MITFMHNLCDILKSYRRNLQGNRVGQLLSIFTRRWSIADPSLREKTGVVLVTYRSNRTIFIKIHHYIRSLERESVPPAPLFSTTLKKNQNKRRKARNQSHFVWCVLFLRCLRQSHHLVVSSLNRDISSVYKKALNLDYKFRNAIKIVMKQ